MKFTILAAASGLAGLTSASGIGSLPSCAQPCVLTYVSGGTIAGCSSLDISCICSNGSFLSSIACCLAAACDAADQATTITFAHDLCSTNGVNNLPDTVSCSTDAVASSTTSTSSSSSATAAAVTTSTSSTTEASTTGSASQTSTSSSATTHASTTGSTSKTTSSTSAANTSSKSSSAASTSATGNAAPQQAAGLTGMIAAALAAALL